MYYKYITNCHKYYKEKTLFILSGHFYKQTIKKVIINLPINNNDLQK